MDKVAFDEMIETQKFHWWFKGKRNVLKRIINSFNLPKGCKILEIGCGVGANIEMLTNFGDVWALEVNEYALDYAVRTNDGVVIKKGWLPEGLSAISGREFDLICLFDVLEHIEFDEMSLRNIREFLKCESKLLITVPAYQWLFSRHDHNLGHFRRYNKISLSDKLASSGYRVLYLGYMNMLSLPLMAASRFFDRYVRKDGVASGTKIPSRVINSVLFFAFSLETLWVPRFSSPFGGSVVAIAEKY
ncbi:MAG: class I SAM-dependent methyltransferase [Synergistaceae bacterium]|jgi:SAM-dependent methyltransferase|nr:class I SAM-dependent methyltransferase [Synergistaceae bacterium]